MIFVLLLLPSYMELFVSLYLFICTKYVALRAALESTVSRSGRSAKPLSPFLLYSFSLSFFFFGTIFEMHSQLSSANLFALALAELQDHAGSPGETRARLASLPSVVKASSSECY